MIVQGCVSCNTLVGHILPPGGVVHENGFWMVFLRSSPLLTPGQGFIILKRHCEELRELTTLEVATLGPVMQQTAEALHQTLRPAKIHFGLYAEAVKHIHVHVFPRMPYMPAGNIPVTFLGAWYQLLHKLRLRRAYSDQEVAHVATQMRAAFQRMS